ncbi:hypothetical protein JMJ77_0003190, partial [Colletotrichum scovillei]
PKKKKKTKAKKSSQRCASGPVDDVAAPLQHHQTGDIRCNLTIKHPGTRFLSKFHLTKAFPIPSSPSGLCILVARRISANPLLVARVKSSSPWNMLSPPSHTSTKAAARSYHLERT